MNIRRRNSLRSVARRLSSPGSTGKVILIVTEGEKTEPCYLKGLRNHLKLSAAEIEVVPAAFDALSIVNRAIELRTARNKKVRQSCAVPYDYVWAVFDTERADTNPRLNDAIQKAHAQKILIALSNPCFEFWLLLHEEYTTAPFLNCAEVIRRIKAHYLPDYEKANIQIDRFIPKIPDAVRNSNQCREHHRSAGSDGNPSTDVDLLVREMNEATRPHYRIGL
jgi:hypothetical protein